VFFDVFRSVSLIDARKTTTKELTHVVLPHGKAMDASTHNQTRLTLLSLTAANEIGIAESEPTHKTKLNFFCDRLCPTGVIYYKFR
jgi:UDP-N-acetylmuramyl pentapeptide synthase